MILADVNDVLERMNLQNMVGVGNTDSVQSSLESATTMIESILRTKLFYKTRIDYFNNTLGLYDTFTPYTLFLTQRHLTGDAIEVYNTSANEALLDDIAGLTQIDSLYHFIDRKKGTLRILGSLNTSYSGIAVKYTAGFKEGSASIPGWLKEAAISAAVYVHHTHAATHNKKDIVDMSKPLQDIIYTHVNEHIFTPYDGLYAVRSTEL